MIENHPDSIAGEDTWRTVIACDVKPCRSRLDVAANLSHREMRQRAAELGWTVRNNDFIAPDVVDYCPSHADRGHRIATVDTLRVFRDRAGNLAAYWPDNPAARLTLHMLDGRYAELVERDTEWTELAVWPVLGGAAVHVLDDGESCADPAHRHVVARPNPKPVPGA